MLNHTVVLAGLFNRSTSQLIPAPDLHLGRPIERLAAHLECQQHPPTMVRLVRDNVAQRRKDPFAEPAPLGLAALCATQHATQHTTEQRLDAGSDASSAASTVSLLGCSLGLILGTPAARSFARFSSCAKRRLCICANSPATPRPPRFESVHSHPSSLIVSISSRLIRQFVRQASARPPPVVLGVHSFQNHTTQPTLLDSRKANLSVLFPAA